VSKLVTSLLDEDVRLSNISLNLLVKFLRNFYSQLVGVAYIDNPYHITLIGLFKVSAWLRAI